MSNLAGHKLSEKTAAAADHRRKFDVDRSAVTRAKLMDAAVDCLNRVGYAATTTILVAATANVSRGSMLHHYPTKVEMMLNVIEYCDLQVVNWHLDHRDTRMTPKERFLAISAIAWQAAREPWSVALLEIEVGARSDLELAAQIPQIAAAIQARRLDSVWQAASEIGLTNRAEVDDMTMLYLSALRGLLVTRLTLPASEQDRLDRAFALLERSKKALVEEWLRDQKDG